jgi:hypothetical protein
MPASPFPVASRALKILCFIWVFIDFEAFGRHPQVAAFLPLG